MMKTTLLPCSTRMHAAALLMAGMLTACSNQAEQSTDTTPQVSGDRIKFADERSANLQTAAVANHAERTLELSGRITWNEDHTVRVFSPYSGRVTRIMVALGDHVKAGQPLAMLDSPDYGSAQADYRKALAAHTLAQSSLSRAQQLYEHGIIAQKDMEQAQSDASAASAETDRAAQVLKQFSDAGAAVDQQLILRSPIEGVVVGRAINPGQELRTDQSSDPLFVVTNPDSVWLMLDAHEDELSALKTGQSFDFTVRSDTSSQQHTGKILRIADLVDPNSRTIKVLALADNRERALKGEMFVTARLRLAADQLAFVPATAVYLSEGHHFVFVKDGDSYAKKEVAVGSASESQLPVYDGLKAGDVVVTQGALFLQQVLDSNSKG